MGACRKCELYNMSIHDVEILDTHIKITLPETKTNKSRFFVVESRYSETIKKYLNSRPAKSVSSKLFLSYRNGKCINQVIGKNKLGSMPKEIAEFLSLPDASMYTGHSFRRTSTTILADSGVNISTIKRHGGWKSTSVAEGYVEESVNNKRKVCNRIVDAINAESTSNNTFDDSDDEAPKKKKSKKEENSNVNNNFKFTFQFNNLKNN